METVKCVVVGDGAVGKTCLLISYTTNMFPSEYIPTVFDNYTHNVVVGGAGPVGIDLWDTYGYHEDDRLRPLNYAKANVFLVCYSVISTASLENIKSTWFPELERHCPSVPIMLVGLKTDLRKDPGMHSWLAERGRRMVSEAEAQEVSKFIRSAASIECSALTQENLKQTFDIAIGLALSHKRSIKE